MEGIIDFNKPVSQQLDGMRPEKPKCSEVAAKDDLDNALLMEVPDGPFKGMSYIRAASLARLKFIIENPDQASLGELAKAAQPSTKQLNVGVGDGLKELFGRFNEPAEEVIDVGGHK